MPFETARDQFGDPGYVHFRPEIDISGVIYIQQTGTSLRAHLPLVTTP